MKEVNQIIFEHCQKIEKFITDNPDRFKIDYKPNSKVFSFFLIETSFGRESRSEVVKVSYTKKEETLLFKIKLLRENVYHYNGEYVTSIFELLSNCFEEVIQLNILENVFIEVDKTTHEYSSLIRVVLENKFPSIIRGDEEGFIFQLLLDKLKNKKIDTNLPYQDKTGMFYVGKISDSTRDNIQFFRKELFDLIEWFAENKMVINLRNDTKGWKHYHYAFDVKVDDKKVVFGFNNEDVLSFILNKKGKIFQLSKSTDEFLSTLLKENDVFSGEELKQFLTTYLKTKREEVGLEQLVDPPIEDLIKLIKGKREVLRLARKSSLYIPENERESALCKQIMHQLNGITGEYYLSNDLIKEAIITNIPYVLQRSKEGVIDEMAIYKLSLNDNECILIRIHFLYKKYEDGERGVIHVTYATTYHINQTEVESKIQDCSIEFLTN